MYYANLYNKKFDTPMKGTYGSASYVPLTYLEETADTKKLLDNMVAAGKRAEQVLPQMTRIMLSAIGNEAVKQARDLIMGKSSIPATLVAATETTMLLRHQNTKNWNPLYEYGVLARNISARILNNNSELNIFINSSKRTPPKDRPGHTPLGGGINQLASNLENGYSMNITDKAVRYFKMMAGAYRDALKGHIRAGGYTGAVDYVMAQAAQIGFLKLASLGKGKYAVPPRPFMRPAIEHSLKTFFERDYGGWAQMMEQFIVHNRVSFQGGALFE